MTIKPMTRETANAFIRGELEYSYIGWAFCPLPPELDVAARGGNITEFEKVDEMGHTGVVLFPQPVKALLDRNNRHGKIAYVFPALTENWQPEAFEAAGVADGHRHERRNTR